MRSRHLRHSNAIRTAKDVPLSALKAKQIEVPVWAWITIAVLALYAVLNWSGRDDFQTIDPYAVSDHSESSTTGGSRLP